MAASPSVGKRDDGKRGGGASAHGVNVAERIRRGNLAERKRIVGNRREKIDCLDERQFIAQLIHPGVVVGFEANEKIRIIRPW